MEIHLFDKSKLTFARTKTGASIALWKCGNFDDGHGWLQVSGCMLDEAEVAALLATLTPPTPPPLLPDAA